MDEFKYKSILFDHLCVRACTQNEETCITKLLAYLYIKEIRGNFYEKQKVQIMHTITFSASACSGVVQPEFNDINVRTFKL